MQRLLRLCLAKDPKHRLHDVADARLRLKDHSLAETGAARVAQPAPTSHSAWLALALLLPIAVIAGWLLSRDTTEQSLPTVRFEVPAPEGERFLHLFRHGLALSPDGRYMAFVSGKDTGQLWGQTGIWLHDLSRGVSRPLPGADQTGQPVYSPDGQWLAFSSSPPGLLRKIPVLGGEAQTLCECDASYGATWGPDEVIVFGGAGSVLWQVSAFGGEPVELTRLDQESGESAHQLPHFLPDGSAVLFTVVVGQYEREQTRIEAYSLSTGQRKHLLDWGSDARYVPPGYLAFARQGKLFAARFDAERLEVLGRPVEVLDGVSHAIQTPYTWSQTWAANFVVGDNGTLAYLAGGGFPEQPRRPVLLDLQGGVEVLDIEAKEFVSARVSEDGRRVLFGDPLPARRCLAVRCRPRRVEPPDLRWGPHLCTLGPGAGEAHRRHVSRRRVDELCEGPGIRTGTGQATPLDKRIPAQGGRVVPGRYAPRLDGGRRRPMGHLVALRER